jgi:hypothetical protein
MARCCALPLQALGCPAVVASWKREAPAQVTARIVIPSILFIGVLPTSPINGAHSSTISTAVVADSFVTFTSPRHRGTSSPLATHLTPPHIQFYDSNLALKI